MKAGAAAGGPPGDSSRDDTPEPRGGSVLEALLQSRLSLRWRDVSLSLLAPHSTFSAGRIDAGTRLLLDSLPERGPGSFLDLGCGYGALGLPVAARHPSSRGLLVDRDLLAVEFCRRNATLAGLRNVEVVPSLGYRDLPPAGAPGASGAGPSGFDWILCNVPARAGDRAVAHLIRAGLARLHADGLLRLVIIAPLAGRLDSVLRPVGIRLREVARGEGHVVLDAMAGEGAPDEADPGLDAYLRDRVRLELPDLLELDRPTDLADEPHRLADAIPLVAEHLPPAAPRRALSFRCGYGLVPALLLARYPGCRVVAQDRDLLAGAFTRRNCARSGDRLEVQERVDVAEAGEPRSFDLVVGELSPPLGTAGNLREIAQALSLLEPGGRLLATCLSRQWRESIRAAAGRLRLERRAARGSVVLVEAVAP